MKNKKNITIKKTVLASALILGMSPDSVLSSPVYIGASYQLGNVGIDLNKDSSENIDYSSHITSPNFFIGYEFEKNKFLPYRFAIEANYFKEKNGTNGIIPDPVQPTVDYNINSSLKIQMYSLNTIHTYDVKVQEQSVQWGIMGIVGLNYTEFEINEYNNYLNYSANEKKDTYGINLGIGSSFKAPKGSVFEDHLIVRVKVIHSIFNDAKFNVNSLNKIDGITNVTVDIGYKF